MSNIKSINISNFIVPLVGYEDAGTVQEIGYGYAIRKSIFLLHTS